MAHYPRSETWRGGEGTAASGVHIRGGGDKKVYHCAVGGLLAFAGKGCSYHYIQDELW